MESSRHKPNNAYIDAIFISSPTQIADNFYLLIIVSMFIVVTQFEQFVLCFLATKISDEVINHSHSSFTQRQRREREFFLSPTESDELRIIFHRLMFAESTDRPIRLRHQVLQSLAEHAETDCLCHHADAGREDWNHSWKVLLVRPAELRQSSSVLNRILYAGEERLWQRRLTQAHRHSKLKIHGDFLFLLNLKHRPGP
jgi:hypothetical protein